jgi:PAS domain-containing protein
MLAVGLDGAVIYANLACAHMLGYDDACVVTGWPVSALLADYAYAAPPDCLAALTVADNAIVDFCHAEGFRIRTVISQLLLRADDQLVLISITDLTESLWAM